MPCTSLSLVCRRRITSEALILRSPSGFRLIDILPLLVVMFVPSAPINEERLSTAGSARMTLAISCCSAAMALGSIVGDACEMPFRNDDIEKDGEQKRC